MRINPRRTAHARYGPQGYESITRGLPLVACGVHGLATLVDSIWESTHALRCASLCLQGTQTERIYQFQWIGFFARHISRTLSFQENHCFFSGSHSSEPNDIAYNPLRGLYKRRQTHVQTLAAHARRELRLVSLCILATLANKFSSLAFHHCFLCLNIYANCRELIE